MNTKHNKRLFAEIILAFIIISLPFGLYIHLFFKDNAETLYFLGYAINHGYDGSDTFLWVVIKKLIAVFILAIFFITSKLWWRYFILSPILLFVYTLLGIFIIDLRGAESDFINHFSIAVLLLVLCLVLFTFNYLFNRLNKTKTINTFPKYIFLKKKYDLIEKKSKDYLNQTRLRNLELDRMSYLYKVFHSRRILKDRFGIIENDSMHDSNKAFRMSEILFSSILLAIPFLFYVYKLIPEGLSTYNLLFITLENNGFIDVRTSVWYLAHVLCFIIPLCIWFITEVRWWKYAILSPIIIGCYQIHEAFFHSTEVLDEHEYFKSFPYILVVIIVLLILSYFISYKYKILNIYDQLTDEVKELVYFFEKENLLINEAKIEFAEIQKDMINHRVLDKITKLMHLQKELILQLEKIAPPEK